MHRFKRFWVNIDRAGNNLFLNGQLDETISAHSARARQNGERWACVLCRFLSVFDHNHCDKQTIDSRGDPNP